MAEEFADFSGPSLREHLDRWWSGSLAGRPTSGLAAAMAVLAMVAVAAIWWVWSQPPSEVDQKWVAALGLDGIDSPDPGFAPSADPAHPAAGVAGDGAQGGGQLENAGAATTGTGSAVGHDGETGPPATIMIHVVGAVEAPGVVVMNEGARVVDAVEAAGGATEAADLQQVNLAVPLSDGMQVRIPVAGEDAGPTVVLPLSPTGASQSEQATQTVNVNTSSAAELETLPGIGPSLAHAIVAYRDEHGPFSTIDDLVAVPGIGPAKLAQLADAATV